MKKDAESALWGWLRRGVKTLGGARAHVRRVENQVVQGDPDVEGCVDGGEFNVELKACPAPTGKGGVLVRIEEHQIYWLVSRRRAGGQAWLLVRVGSGPKMRHYLVAGEDTEQLRKTVPETTLVRLSHIPGNADAPTILTFLGKRTLA